MFSKVNCFFFFTCLFALGLAFVPRAEAEIMFGVEGWSTQLSGTIYETNNPQSMNISLRDDLGMDRHLNPNYIFAFTTPLFFPNVRLEYGSLLSNGFTTVQGKLCFNDVCYTNGKLVSQLAIKQARVLFYWNVLDNAALKLSVGLDLRWINMNLPATGTVTTTPQGGGPSSTQQVSTSNGIVSWLPAASVALTVHLPANFDVYVKGSGLPYASNYLYDFRAGLKYNFSSGLSLDAGYRRWRLHLDDTRFEINGDLDFKGPYVGLFWSF